MTKIIYASCKTLKNMEVYTIVLFLINVMIKIFHSWGQVLRVTPVGLLFRGQNLEGSHSEASSGKNEAKKELVMGLKW
jgi:hypothetical protein